MFKNNSVLFIGPKTFGYESIIKSKIEELGGDVVYFDDRPSDRPLDKIFIRLAPYLVKNKIRSYFKQIVEKTKDTKFDYIFCIKQECFPRDLLIKLFASQKKAKKVFYTWDSFKNNANGLNNLDLFERVFTFDSQDAKKYNLPLRPLFFFDGISNSKDVTLKYDYSFVGSVHYKRYLAIKEFLAANKRLRNSFIYLFVPSKLLFYIRKFALFPVYGSSKKSDFEFQPLDKIDLTNVFQSSKSIIDFPNHGQSGLTMRTIEALGASKKLITSNSSIKEYDFFNANNIHIIEDGDFEVPAIFFESPYEEVKQEIYDRYTLEGWLQEILIGNQ